MIDHIIVILKPSGGRDIFFAHHTVHVKGTVPARDEEQWKQQDINFLPVAIDVAIPDYTTG